MEIHRHEATNHVFKAPSGQEADVSDLPVVIAETDVGIGLFSFWRPSPEELALLAAGHGLQLGIYQETHPVVSLGVSKDPL